MKNDLPLSLSSLEKEGPFQASKWVKIQALLDGNEMKKLLEHLDEMRIFSIRGVVPDTGIEIPAKTFLKHYSNWIQALKEGRDVSSGDLSKVLSCVWTLDSDALYLLPVNGDRYIPKVRKPAILVQAHFMGYSSEEKNFRPMILGSNSLFWGLQFSYPQIFQRPDTKEFVKVDRSEEFRNTALFSKLRKWMRDFTKPTPFCIDQKIVNIPMRLGKECFGWIHQHPQIIQHGHQVYVD